MAGKNSIQYKLMRVILTTCAITLLLTCGAYFGYEYYNFQQNYLNQLSKTGNIIASNSTAALAFDNPDDANEILSSLKADPHIIGAALYNADGQLFAKYPLNLNDSVLPRTPSYTGFRNNLSNFEGFQPVMLEKKYLGSLYLRTDMEAMYKLFVFDGLIALVVFSFSLLVAYLLSKRLQQGISKPILNLAKTSQAISENRDFSVRALKVSDDEVGSLTDAFNQMLAEIEEQNQEITSLNVDLEQKIQRRTRQLEAANKELEAFSYSVSHDLRAPLRVVSGYASILEQDYKDSINNDGRKLLHHIRQNIHRMGRLIDGLLSFARLGKQELAKTQVDMDSLTKSVVSDIAKSMDHHAKINLGKMLPAMADVALLEHVMSNLISNAVKYSSKKENPEVGIKSEGRKNDIVYSVSDNGAGFDMQYADKLFGVFQRLHTSDEFEGTGIGLATVQRIITKHGGKVWAEGEEGKGATFYFSLPK